MTIMQLTEQDVEALIRELQDVRRHLHSDPELMFNEHRTAAFLAKRVREIGMDQVLEGIAQTGVVARLNGTKPIHNEAVRPKCIALRADMDGLPIQELNDCEYRSQNPGVSHACGHDAHMAMLLVAARVLAESRHLWSGTVIFVFQPAEEGGGGGRLMVEEGVLDGVDEVYGCHVWNYARPGLVLIKEGPLMAASDFFDIIVHGTGGHGAAPQGTCDAVLATTHLVSQLHTIVSRNVAPLDSAVLTVGKVQSGYNYNIISDRADVCGTVRVFKDDVRETIIHRMQQVCKGIEESFEVKVDLNYKICYPATVNTSKECVEALRLSAIKAVGKSNVEVPEPTMASEDFSYFLRARPGCFYFLGSSPDPNGEPIAHHTTRFDIDESCMIVGCKIWIQLVADRLGS